MVVDPRVTQLASNLIGYSLALQEGETLYIDMVGSDTSPLGQELIRLATEAGAIPFWHSFDDAFTKPFFRAASEAQHKAFAAFHRRIMEGVDAYVGIRGPANPFDLGDLSPEQKHLKQTYHWNEVHSKTRLQKRWVVLRYPNSAMATLAGMSQEAFEAFYFRVCNLDYARLSRAMDPLVALMERTDRVRLVAPGTDLSFSIQGIPAIKCDGKLNIPDGEVYTAPVRESVNGTITFNTSSLYQGKTFRNVRLEVDAGRIVRAHAAEGEEELERIFATDLGAAYFGEFAIGVNPYILHPMNDTLFDEKIQGSIHLTPGSSYENADNGNRSAIHWDLVLIQRPEYGGGELYFDDRLIRRDGQFVVEELLPLNADTA